MEENIFEYASKNKVRFPYKGQVSTEDLWDLSAGQLDAVYKTLNVQKKTTEEDSLLEKKSKEDAELAVKIEIVTHIFKSKMEEQKAKERSAVNAEKKHRLMELIAKKEDDALGEMSVDELKKMLEEVE